MQYYTDLLSAMILFIFQRYLFNMVMNKNLPEFSWFGNEDMRILVCSQPHIKLDSLFRCHINVCFEIEHC